MQAQASLLTSHNYSHMGSLEIESIYQQENGTESSARDFEQVVASREATVSVKLVFVMEDKLPLTL